MKPDIQLSPPLQRVHGLREEGKSQRVIAEILGAEGVPLPPGRSKKWNQPGVRACLQQLEALPAPPASSPSEPAPPPVPRLNGKFRGRGLRPITSSGSFSFIRSGLVFPSPTGRVLSDSTLSKLLGELGIGAVPHGFRSSFRDWAAERIDVPREVCELALAHVNSDRVEAAYRRNDLFERRRGLMADWADYISA